MNMSKTQLATLNILLSLLTLLLSHFLILVISKSPSYDQAILHRIKHHWEIKSWDSTVSPCNNWHGIECTDGERVTGISLGSQGIRRKIPPYICYIQNLITLDLRGNNITGEFPTILYNCTNLRTLVLAGNSFVGQLPNDVNKLSPKLQHLDLSRNSFSGDIPSSLAQLKELTFLYLYSNSFNGTFPSKLGSLQNLRVLALSDNPLTPTHLPKEFGMLKSLRTLCMCRCRWIGEIPNDFANLTSLEELDLASNNLMGSIPSKLFLLKNLTYIFLRNNSLTGEIPAQLTGHSSLAKLDLNNNQLSGELPSYLISLKSLETLNLGHNNLSGSILADLGSLPRLQNLNLSNNKFSGELPSKIILWKSLETISLANNNLSGPLPAALGSLTNLQNLDLSNNKLSGQIPPELGRLSLNSGYSMNLSSNCLSGKIPDEFDNNLFSLAFLDNANLCSEQQISNLARCSYSQKPRHRHSALILVAGVTIFLLFLGFTILWVRKRNKEEHSTEGYATWELKQFHNVDFTEKEIVSGLIDTNMIGSGGSGKVYMIIVNDSGDKVAVKRIWYGRKLKDELEKQFLAEVEILGTFRHANIVKLLCCISSTHEKLLVYEYMENQSLDKWLHRIQKSTTNSTDPHTVLDWPTRLRIAVEAAKGLCYLHNDCSPPIIHRDLKSSNILLDTKFNAKIADFGLAKMTVNKTGESNTASTVVGSFGYIAPEYWRTKRMTEKIDVYSFGVVLLELTTGKHPCKGNDHMNLADWSWQYCYEEHSIIEALDDDIKETGSIEQMVNVFKLGLMCTSKMPSSRPTMQQALKFLEEWSHQDDHEVTLTIDDE